MGPPGPARARLALAFCQLLDREVEVCRSVMLSLCLTCQYIAISRDTIEGDIKQRREIRGASAFYVDQCAVRAAINGRVLILDGIEKVVPIYCSVCFEAL